MTATKRQVPKQDFSNLVYYTFVGQNIMSRKDLFIEQLLLAGAEQYARGLRQGNPPQSSSRLCPVLVEEDHTLDPAIGRRHTHAPQVLNRGAIDSSRSAAEMRPEGSPSSRTRNGETALYLEGFVTSGPKSNATHGRRNQESDSNTFGWSF